MKAVHCGVAFALLTWPLLACTVDEGHGAKLTLGPPRAGSQIQARTPGSAAGCRSLGPTFVTLSSMDSPDYFASGQLSPTGQEEMTARAKEQAADNGADTIVADGVAEPYPIGGSPMRYQVSQTFEEYSCAPAK